MTLTKHQMEDFEEGYHAHGEVHCDGCGVVALSEADDLDEAIEIWNQHIHTEHSSANGSEEDSNV